MRGGTQITSDCASQFIKRKEIIKKLSLVHDLSDFWLPINKLKYQAYSFLFKTENEKTKQNYGEIL